MFPLPVLWSSRGPKANVVACFLQLVRSQGCFGQPNFASGERRYQRAAKRITVTITPQFKAQNTTAIRRLLLIGYRLQSYRKRSEIMCAGGTPRAISASSLASIMADGPQTK